MKLGTMRNPKFLRLARRLGVGKAATAGHLEALWHFASEQAPAGDVGRWEDADIEEGCFWEGKPGAMVAAMVSEGWLDECKNHRLVVHHWSDHAPEMIRKRNSRSGVEFAAVTPVEPAGIHSADNGGQRQTTAATVCRTADNGCPPDPTLPYQTPPHPTPPDQGAPPPSGGRRRACLCPESLTDDQKKSAIEWIGKNGFSRAQVQFAWEQVRDWSHSKGEKRVDWLAVLRKGMRDGWALKGFEAKGEDSKPKGMAYREWTGYQQDEPEVVASLIDASLGLSKGE